MNKSNKNFCLCPLLSLNRIKSGNPGYFVVFNPTDNRTEADFSNVKSLPDQLTVYMVSKSYNEKDIAEK